MRPSPTPIRTCARRSCRAAPAGSTPACAPTAQRNREFLEQFSLDTLKMVGTLNLGGNHYGLVRDQGWPRASRGRRRTPGNQRRQDHRNHAFKDRFGRDHSRRTGRLHRTSRGSGVERVIGRETHRMKWSILHTLRERMTWLALACGRGHARGHAARAPRMRRPPARQRPRIPCRSIDVQTLSGKQLQLTLHLSGPAPEPLTFTIDKPARISLDLPNTALALPSRRIDVGSAGVDTVLAAEANGRTRVVLESRSAAAVSDPCQRQRHRGAGGRRWPTRMPPPGVPAPQPAHAAARRSGRWPRDQEHRLPPRRERRRPAGRAPVRSAYADRSEAAGLADPGRLRRHRSAEAACTRRYDTLDFGTPVTGSMPSASMATPAS